MRTTKIYPFLLGKKQATKTREEVLERSEKVERGRSKFIWSS